MASPVAYCKGSSFKLHALSALYTIYASFETTAMPYTVEEGVNSLTFTLPTAENICFQTLPKRYSLLS
jgi:hypothetical protein